MTDPKTMITPAIAVPTIALAQDAIERRDALLAKAAKAVKPIDSPENCARKEDFLRAMQDYQRTVESMRKEAKKPVLKIGKDIDALADELAAPLNEHIQRISRACGAYRAEQERKAEAERRAREDEIRKAQEEIRLKAEAEQRRIAEEQRKADEAARAAKSELDRAKAAAEQTRLAEEQAKSAKAAEMEAKAAVAQIVPASAQVVRKGTVLTRKVDFVVTDVYALAAARPELVKVEPRDGDIRKALLADEATPLPGVTAKYSDEITTRR